MLLKGLWNYLAKIKILRFKYKYINIYVDSGQNLICIPIGESKKWGPISIDSVSELKAPYSDEQLEQELTDSLNRCYSMRADDDLKVSSLEKYLGVKGFAKACQGRKIVEYRWNAKDGYYITPTNKVKGKGYLHMEDQRIFIGKSFNKGDLANAVKQAIELSKTY
jgi:hypothetical protein